MTTPYGPEGPPEAKIGAHFEGSVTRHGTLAGWTKHKEEQSEMCDPCYQAKARYDWSRSNTGLTQIANRRGARAQGRANTRLRQAHPEEYAHYYAEEKARLTDDE